MCEVKMLVIIIPSEDCRNNNSYYVKNHNFKLLKGRLFFPGNNFEIALKTMTVDGEALLHCPPRRFGPIFRMDSHKNIISSFNINSKVMESKGHSRIGDISFKKVRDLYGNQFEMQASADQFSCEMTPLACLTLYIPTHDVILVEDYYKRLFSENVIAGKIFIDIKSSMIMFEFLKIEKDEKNENGPSEYFPIFKIELEKNFLSFCLNLKEKGAKFTFACEFPGGLFARVVDPAGNQFEIECNNFEEDDNSADSSEIDGFFRY